MTQQINTTTAAVIIGIVIAIVVAIGVYKWRSPGSSSEPSGSENMPGEQYERERGKQVAPPAPQPGR